MSEFFDVPEDEGSEPESEFQPDPATIAFLDQEAAAFAEVADEFEQLYGFRHDCRCDKDYAEGRVGEVTECYAGMIVESLAACSRMNHENKQLRSMVSKLVQMNNTLMDNLGAEDEDAIVQAEIDALGAIENDPFDSDAADNEAADLENNG